jgi:hypothetical protein
MGFNSAVKRLRDFWERGVLRRLDLRERTNKWLEKISYVGAY